MRTIWALLTSLVLIAAHAASAEERIVTDKEAYQVYEQILSPFCPGRSLNDCPSSKAHELKEQIRTELQSGMPETEILESVFKQYGDEYRAVPKAQGVGLLAWAVPVIFFVLGGLIVVWRLARSRT